MIRQNGNNNQDDDDDDENENSNEPSTINYLCSVCPYKRSNFSLVQRHLSIHLTGQGVVCPLCSYTTSSDNLMIRHMTTVHPTSQTITKFPSVIQILTANIIEQHQCPICSYQCERSEALDLHRRLEHDDDEFDIDSSSSIIDNDDNDDDDINLPVNTNNNIFQCPLCTPSSNTNNYSNLEQFTIHVFTNHNNHIHNNQSCPFCSFIAHTTSTYTLLEHIKLHFNGTLVQPDLTNGIENVKELLIE
jgi:rubrerythrin